MNHDLPYEYAVIFGSVLYIISLYVVYRLSGGHKLISPPGLYMLFYTFYFFVWALVLSREEITYQVGATLLPPPHTRMLMQGAWAALSFAAGTCIATICLKFKPKAEVRYYKYRRIIHDISGPSFRLSFFGLLLLAASLAAAFYYVKGVPIIAIKTAAASAHYFRAMSEARAASLSGSGYFLQGITVLFPLASIFIYAKYIIERRLSLRIFSALLIVLAILLMVSLTSRGHFAIFFILLALVHQYIDRHMPWVRAFLLLGVMIILFVVASFLKLGYIADFGSLARITQLTISVLASRLSLGTKQYEGLLKTIPSDVDYLYGAGYLWDASSLLPGAQIGFNRWGFNLLYPKTAVPANITPLSVGEFFANFGMIGTVGGSFLLGVLLQYIYIYIIRRADRVSVLIALVYLSTYLSKSAMNGLGAMFEPIVATSAAFVFYFACAKYASCLSSCKVRSVIKRERGKKNCHA